MKRVAALYVEKNGAYFGLRSVDPWDEARDARRYRGRSPVVAHPPCARWSVLAFSVQARYGYEVGDDGGCFVSALDNTRRCGGVLEHPSRSLAFGKKYGFDLGRPRLGSWQPTGDGGWFTEVSQAAYGHLANKLTWLIYYGKKPPPQLNWSTPKTDFQISYSKKANGEYWKKPLTKKVGKQTPPAFRELLLGMARSCGGTSYEPDRPAAQTSLVELIEQATRRVADRGR